LQGNFFDKLLSCPKTFTIKIIVAQKYSNKLLKSVDGKNVEKGIKNTLERSVLL